MNSGLNEIRQVLRKLWRTPLFTVVTLPEIRPPVMSVRGTASTS